MSKWGYDEQEYLLLAPHGCRKAPKILFRQDLSPDGSAGNPYLAKVNRCCEALESFTFFGDTIRINARGTMRLERQ